MDLIFASALTESDLIDSVSIIRESFATVAEQFGLTKVNAPTHSAFIELRHLKKMQDKGIAMFGIFCESVQVGFLLEYALIKGRQ